MSILEDARVLAGSGSVYDICLGWTFAERSFELTSVERGKSLRVAAAFDDDGPYETVDTEDCWIYDGVCIEFDDWAERCVEAIENVEIKTYQIGTRAPPLVEENELFLREGTGLPGDTDEPFKSGSNHEIGKRMDRLTGTEVDFIHPDAQFLLDIEAGTVEAQLNSTFVYGHYQKLVRDIPQTGWPCRGYDGSGYRGKKPCDYCDSSGYLHEGSAESFVAPVVTDVMDSIDTKFHGVGREDVDVLTLGTGRPFVIETMEPRHRTIDVEQLEGDISTMANGEIEVEGLRFATYNVVERVKKLDTNKEYRTAVELDDNATDAEPVTTLDELTGATIEQYILNRVNHRCANTTRTRHIYGATNGLEDLRCATVEIHGEGGLYIKELISGNEDRTNPGLAGIPGTGAVVTAPDVVTVEDENGPFEDNVFFKD